MTRQNPLGVERGQGAGLWSAFGVALAVVVAYGVSLWVLPEEGPALAWFVGARLLVEATAGALVVVRVVRIPRERAAWTVMAAALGVLLVGDAVQSLAPISASTLRWLAPAINLVFFLGLIGCLGVLVRDRFARLSLSMLLDALISTLGLLCVVFFLTSLVGVGEQATLLSLAYLIPSLLYVSVLVALLSGLNRRPSAAWWLNLGAALLLFLGSLAVGPALALGQLRTPSPVDALWPAAALLHRCRRLSRHIHGGVGLLHHGRVAPATRAGAVRCSASQLHRPCRSCEDCAWGAKLPTHIERASARGMFSSSCSV